MHVHEFQARWRDAGAGLTERAAAQSHFGDLCRVLGQPTPPEADPTGEFYTFEKRVTKLDGATGFADVWWRGRFAWEYKGRGADLEAAYRQLSEYREALENPPLLVVCDLDRFVVHTNFTNTAKHVYRFSLSELDRPEHLTILRNVFTDPNALKPGVTVAQVTETAARQFGEIAGRLRGRGADPRQTAHFLVQLLFCLFAEATGLLPRGLFGQVLGIGRRDPEAFNRQLEHLFLAMREGGYFGSSEIAHFNGGLFAQIDIVPLEPADIATLADAAALDWSSVEPAIFGTLFERSLDPHTRAQRDEIAAGAKALDVARRFWLNPPDTDEKTLKTRTLTNLYNARPTWLANLHARLDRAVWAAYGWPEDPGATDEDTILGRLLALNLERGSSRCGAPDKRA